MMRGPHARHGHPSHISSEAVRMLMPSRATRRSYVPAFEELEERRVLAARLADLPAAPADGRTADARVPQIAILQAPPPSNSVVSGGARGPVMLLVMRTIPPAANQPGDSPTRPAPRDTPDPTPAAAFAAPPSIVPGSVPPATS